jgi:coniferyl-aldehyde dehydrogenase
MRDFTADEIAAALHVQRSAFLRDGPPTVAVRRDRIDRLAALTLENADEFIQAMSQDFGNRSIQAATVSDILGSVTDVAYIRRNVKKWMKPRDIMPVTRAMGVRTRVQARPLGVVGVVAPWNFPVLLLTQPATAAFAAGDRVMMKASEVTPHTAALLHELAPRYFSAEELVVVTGGRETGEAFCSMPFDHLLFTGSPGVGKHVQRSAAEHLVPVTLELGGKNPVVIGHDANIDTAASRVARARMINGGQVCLCPDYVFVPADRIEEFAGAVVRQFRTSFPTVLHNLMHCTIVDDHNFQRVVGLVEDARAKGATVIEAAPEGETLPSAAQRCIAPTVLTNMSDDMRVMNEEVFGPVLTVLPYHNLDDVIGYINTRPSPLACYWFGKDSADFRRFCAHARTGGITRNDFLLHAALDGAPFGGVGGSGMGAYHGKAGFDTFSQYRAVSESRLPGSATALFVPPTHPRLMTALDWIVDKQATRVRKRINRFRGPSGDGAFGTENVTEIASTAVDARTR